MAGSYQKLVYFDVNQSGDGTALTVTLAWNSRNGNLVCNHCPNQPQWCEHIAWAINKRRDLDIIWAPDNNGDHVDMELTVPIFPKTQQYIHVLLRPESGDRRQVFWSDGPDVNIFPAELGYISTGEGIQVIRSLLVEELWMRVGMFSSQPGNLGKLPECQASHHGFQAQEQWSHQLNTSDRTAAIWSVVSNGWCLHCRINDPSNAAPDLIPPNQSGFPVHA